MRILLILAFLLSPNVGFCQKKSKTRDKPTRFYNFDDIIINGKVTKPKVQYFDARQKVKFERLLNLKKDFLKKLKSTSKDGSLR